MEEEIIKVGKKRSFWKFLLIVLFLFLLVLLAGIAVIYKISPKETHSSIIRSITFVVSPGKVAFGDKTKLNILCLGLDYNYTREGIIFSKGARTDTIFAVSLDMKQKDIKIVSIPRDMMVPLADGRGYEKANAPYAIGDIELAKETFEKFLGIQFDYYVVIRIIGFRKLVDELGGVWVDVDKDMDYDDSWGNLHVHLKKGYQKLNGEQAVGFCRFRYDPLGDRARIARQQRFIKALINELKKPGNLLKIEKFSRIAKGNIETDLSFLQILDMARVYKDFQLNSLHTYTLEGEDAMVGGLSMIVPDEEIKERIIGRAFFGTYPYLPEEISLEVLNGTDTAGLADILADILAKKKFKIAKVSYAPEKNHEATVIIDQKDNPEALGVLMDELGTLKIIKQDNKGGEVDFTIIIGRDFKELLNK